MTATKNSDVWLKKSAGMLPSRDLWGPLFLIVFVPPFLVILPYILTELDGSSIACWNKWQTEGFIQGTYNMWYTWKDPVALKIVFGIILLEMALVRLVPGEMFTGPVSPAGIRYSYNTNGFRCYLITMFLYWLGTKIGLYPGGILVDYLGETVSTINVFALLFCVFLHIKGIFAPSSADHGTTNNLVFDYFWGTELNPRLFGWDVKQMTNARFGMIYWGLFMLDGILKQQETYGQVYDTMWVSAGLQLLYVTKFYWWETGYYSSYDIIHDYAGFYLCWGCMCFMPSIYSSHIVWIAHHPVNMGWPIAGSMIALGILVTIIQYDADTQARNFRINEGKQNIWGRKPEYIVAKYKTGDGTEKVNMLLASGYYGDLTVRHLRYTLDIIVATLWCVPCWTDKLMPYVYWPYAVIMLVDRMYRIDIRCHMKYGKYWEEYCRKVPYKMIPYIF